MVDFTNKTFKETYRDFYKAEDGYYRVLFNSGKALQARELIESQTIIQEEIARFGRNIFKEGALVSPGGATVDNKIEYIRLDDSSVIDSDLIGKTVTNGTIELKILDVVVDLTNADPKTLYVQYTDTSSISDSSISPRVSATDTLVGVGTTVTNLIVASADTSTIPVAGRSTKAYFSAGDFFAQGHFVYMEGGSAFIDKYSSTPTTDIGFLIEQKIITESEDTELYDNQGEVPNITAPGAHRYQIKLTPTTSDQIDSDQNFVFVARVVDGIITREVSTFDAYNRINHLLAQRTKEESGDYVVDEFKAIFEEKDETNLNLDVTDGIAYVDGYRLEIGTTDITVPKARQTVTKTLESVPATFGNYIYIDPDNTQGLGNINVFGTLDLVVTDSNGSTTIGTTNLRGIEQDAVGYRAYIFNIQMNSDQSFGNVTHLQDSDSNNLIPVLDNSIHGTTSNNLLFPLPSSSPKTVGAASYTVQKYFDSSSLTVQSDNTLSLSGVEQSGWILAKENGEIQNVAPDDTGKYTGLDSSQNYVALIYDVISATNRTKTTATPESIFTYSTSSPPPSEISLGVVDGISLESVEIKDGDGSFVDLTHQFVFDGGQKDNYYDFAKIKIKSGYSYPSDNVEVKVNFTHFSHSDQGTYFSADSYDSVGYDNIPTHVTAAGEKISLRNVLDFRPTITSSSPSTFSVVKLPQNASSITLDEVKYYLPRIDVLVANSKDSRGDVGFGELQVIQGEPSEVPREPEIPTSSLALYKFKLNPYTFDSSDLTSSFVSNKRFTMKDIGKIEERVTNLYELTTLSLLETNTNALTVLDANGNPRTKAGFIADNFSTFNFSDINNEDYRASINPFNQLRPSFRENLIRLSYSSSNNSTDIAKSGDVTTLPYTHVNIVSQKLATGTMNVNPFAVITQTGHLELSPSSDEWVETSSLPDVMQTNVRRFEDVREDLETRPLLGSLETTRNIPTNSIARSIQEFVGERIVDVQIVPFMRSRIVNFSAKGLRPNTKMFAYFGNESVSDWVRPETSFSRFSDVTQEFGTEYSNALEYPSELGGKDDLITDSKGELNGSFFIPNTTSLSFRTGRQVLKLLDVNVNDESEAMSSTRATYTSTGTIETVQRTVRTTRVMDRIMGRQDPLAQTFFIDQIENPNGIFLTKVRVFVESKDSVIPLQVQIRPVENGIPTTKIIPGAVKFVNPSDITVTTFDDSTTMSSVESNFTTVEFDEPIYLTSGEEYAVVLLAESVEYNVYVAETSQTIVGSRQDKVSRQPTLGSLFLSQNGSTWTPDQTKDLMFELDRAEFNSSGTLLLSNESLPKVTLQNNPIETTTNSTEVEIYHEGHGFVHGDIVTLSNVNTFGDLTDSDVNGSFTISNPTWKGYNITTSSSSSDLVGGGNNVVVTKQAMYDVFIPQIQTITPNGTSISSIVNQVSGKSFGTDRSNDPITNYNLSNQSSSVFLNNVNSNNEPKVIAAADNSSSESIRFTLSLSTQDSKVSPIIDLQRVSVLALENVIDNNDAAQHITTPTVIDDASEGLKVIFAANRPSTSNFEVYVKTAADEDKLSDSDWIQVTIDEPVPSDDNPDTFRDYEFTHNTTQFSAFQVKLVMKSMNSSKSPTIQDLRAIALVV